MKKEAGKKSKLWLWLVIGIVALLAVAGAVLGLILGGGQGNAPEQAGGRPDLYWNVDRNVYLDKLTGLSSREKAEDGQFYVRFVHDGELLELPIVDKQLVNYIDGFDVVGLTITDGVVVDAIEPKKIATEVSAVAYVQAVEGDVLYINTSVAMNGMKTAVNMSDILGVYDAAPESETLGKEITFADLNPMDKVAVYGSLEGETTHVFVSERSVESKIYWRANQFVSNSKTTRVPDEEGYYTIPFFCEGELIELKCKDVVEVNYIDKQSRYSCHFGLRFDDDGYIVEALVTGGAIRGTVRSERYDITAIDGNTITTTKIIGSNPGVTDTFTLTDDVIIYDVSPAAKSEDRQGLPVDSLQLGDRIVCFADTMGNPKVVYVSERVVDNVLWCYSRARKYDSTLQTTTRVPENGWYVFEVFINGEVRKIRTNSKEVATEMDSVSAAVFGVKLDGDVVTEVYSVTSVFGYSAFCQGRYITAVVGSIFTCVKPTDATATANGVMDPNCKVYNMSDVGAYGETTLREGDYIYAYQRPDGTIVQIWVMRRMVDLPVYCSVKRMYNSTTKETTRVPDEEGWYIFEVACNGKLTTVKTQDKALASKMDSFTPAMALRVDGNGVVKEAYDGRYATGGYRRAHGYTVTAVSGNTVETRYKNADGSIATRTLTLTNDCKTYNVSPFVNDHFGETTRVKVGDTITAYTDTADKTVILWVRGRQTDKLYWNSLKLYDDTNAVSLREPDAEGWYVYKLAANGKVETLKTKEKAIADQVDYYGGAFTLNVKDGIILGVGSPSYAKNTSGSSVLNYDVMEIKGNKVTLQYHAYGSAKNGEKITITLNSKCKIYEVGPDASKFGAETTLKVGDRIRAYQSDVDDTYTYVFIRFRASRDEGLQARCEVCDKEVYWEPWVGGSFSTAGGHFYLPADVETTYLPCSTGRSTLPVTTVCLDLNGHTYHRTKGRPLYVYANATLNIMDTVGGGTVLGGGPELGTSGGVLGVTGGTVNFYSGTLKLAEEHADQLRGGVLYIGTNSSANAIGVFNMYGGTITGGEVLGRGGNIAISGGILNMYDGVIENGNVIGGYSGEHGGGGNIVSMSNGIINIYGGTITGGTCAGNGGNIYAGTGELNIYGGTISNGNSVGGGGNIFTLEKTTITGGTITGGVTQTKSGGNLHVYNYGEKSALSITGGTFTNGTAASYGGNMYCEIPAVIKNAKFENGAAANGGNIYTSKDTDLIGCTITGGKINAEKGSGGNIYTGGGNWTLENTTISGGTSTARGGNIYSGGATITMNSGTITGGTSGTGNANGGGNICNVSNGVFILNGGTISNGTSVNTAGNILSGSGTVIFNGGKVTGGTAATRGADIYIYGGSTDVTFNGGELGVADLDAVKTLTISGKPVFEQLILASGVVANVENVDKDAAINLVADGIFTAELTDAAAYTGAFKPVMEGYVVYVEENALAAAAGVKEAQCAICGETVLFKKWSGAGADGHYYLDENVDMVAEVEIPAGSKLTLDLAGHTVTSAVRAFLVKGDMVVYDSAANGQIVGGLTGTSTANRGGVIRVNGGSFALHSGTLRYAGTGVNQAGVLYLEGAATADLIGGIITDGISSDRGGNIAIAGESTVNLSGTTVQNGNSGTGNGNGGGNIFVVGSSVLNITGGKVIGGTSKNTGGNVLVGTGYINVSGGEISGGTAATKENNLYIYYNASNCNITGGNIESVTYTDAASFSVSGNPVIGLFTVDAGKAFTLGDLTEGADITVAASGTFTTANEKAQSFVDAGYVKLADTSKILAVEDNKLVVSELPVGAKLATCQHCGEEVIWYQFGSESRDGHYYLADHFEQTVETGHYVAEGQTLVLDLAGFNMTAGYARAFDCYGHIYLMDTVGGSEVVTAGQNSADALGGLVRVRKDASFTLYSGTLRLADEHSATIKRGGVLYLDSGATATIKGGTIMNGVTTERGGNIYLVGTDAYLLVEGGLITGGTCGTGNANGGGNIAVLTASTVEIKGGTVSNGTSPKTAGNIMATGNLIISGGTIEGGFAAGVGQDIYVMNNSGDVTVTGGNITSLTANKPRSLTVSGNPVIGSLELLNGQQVALGELTEGADITIGATGAFAAATAQSEAYITNQWLKTFDRHEIVVADGKLTVVYDTTSYCEHCQKEVTWTAWDGATDNGHFYLAETMTVTDRVNPAAGDVLVLDLNGNTYTNSSTKAFSLKGTLAVLDSIGSGAIVGSGVTGSSKMNGGVIYMESNAIFELYGGTIRHAPGSGAAYRGGTLYVSSSTVKLMGGTIAGGTTTERGGNIYATGASTTITLSGTTITGGHTGTGNSGVGGGNVFVLSSAKFIMTGGKIVDGIADNFGGNVGVGSGTFQMNGGEISGGTAADGAPDVYIVSADAKVEFNGGYIANVKHYTDASVTLSGAPVIDLFEITSDKVITLGELTEGADVTILASGVFTTASEKAQAYVDALYIKVSEGKQITVTDNVMSMGDA